MKDHSIQAFEDLFRSNRFFELRDLLAKCSNDKSLELLFYHRAVAV